MLARAFDQQSDHRKKDDNISPKGSISPIPRFVYHSFPAGKRLEIGKPKDKPGSCLCIHSIRSNFLGDIRNGRSSFRWKQGLGAKRMRLAAAGWVRVLKVLGLPLGFILWLLCSGSRQYSPYSFRYRDISFHCSPGLGVICSHCKQDSTISCFFHSFASRKHTSDSVLDS